MQTWFDRDLDFGHGSLIDASIGNLPRLVTSPSIDKQRDDSRLMTIREVKLIVVERAIDALKYASAAKDCDTDDDAATRSKLDEFLNLNNL